jgi:hypothetical protein
VYEHAGAFVVCTGTAAIMTAFLFVAVTLGRRDLADTPEMLGTDRAPAAEIVGRGVPDLP